MRCNGVHWRISTTDQWPQPHLTVNACAQYRACFSGLTYWAPYNCLPSFPGGPLHILRCSWKWYVHERINNPRSWHRVSVRKASASRREVSDCFSLPLHELSPGSPTVQLVFATWATDMVLPPPLPSLLSESYSISRSLLSSGKLRPCFDVGGTFKFESFFPGARPRCISEGADVRRPFSWHNIHQIIPIIRPIH